MNSPEPIRPDSLQIVTESSCGASPAVPVFNCVVFLRKNESGRLFARVANLQHIEVEGTVERDVLFSVTRQFKSRLREYLSRNEPIPWIDPIPIAAMGEYERFIPIHL